MSTSPDGYVLPPVFKAVGLCASVVGEHGWEGAVAPCPACSSLADGWLATVGTECWTRWTPGLIQHQGSSYVLKSPSALVQRGGSISPMRITEGVTSLAWQKEVQFNS